MIVPSMSHDEMRKEFLHDHRIAQAKADHDYKQLLFDLHKRRQSHAVQTINWKSHLHNPWMSFYNFHDGRVDCLHVCITMDHGNLLKTLIGIEPFTEGETFIGEYNIHFFKRYNERLKLNLPKPMLIVKHYFKHNMRMQDRVELLDTPEKDIFKIFLPVTGGVLLGYQYTAQKWIEAKTFISDEMLRESQIEKAEYLRHYKLEEHK